MVHGYSFFFKCIFVENVYFQIYIGFTQKIDSDVSHSYDGIAERLDGGGMSGVCADVMREVLRGRGRDPADWKGMDERQREAAMELMVLTHVAEAAVPLEEEASLVTLL